MTVLNTTEARARLYSLIDEATETHEPILITGKRGNAVLISEEDWKSIQETAGFYLAGLGKAAITHRVFLQFGRQRCVQLQARCSSALS